MGKIIMEFERGGCFEVILNDRAPKTCKAFMEQLPYEGEVLHARFSGTECFFNMPLGVMAENNVPPKAGSVSFNSDHEQAVCVYYDSNIRSDTLYNNFASLKGDMETLKEVGLRVWKKGTEKIFIRLENDK